MVEILIEFYILLLVSSLVFFFISIFDNRTRVFFSSLSVMMFFLLAFSSGNIEQGYCEMGINQTNQANVSGITQTNYTSAFSCTRSITVSVELMIINFAFAVLSVIFFIVSIFETFGGKQK